MKKWGFPAEKMAELEQHFHGNAKLKERIYHALLFWKEFKGTMATAEELVRIFHLIGITKLSNKLRAMKIYSQALKL